jgi:hypothetical protein
MGIVSCSLAATLACVDGGGASEVVSSLDQRDSFTIHGTGTLFGVTTSGIESRPLDLSAVPFASFSLSHGELVQQAGVGNADGTFSVPVAAGARTWELELNFFGTPQLAIGNARRPDLSQHVLGRLDGVLPTAETDVTINATGLAPWADGDSTQIIVANNGAVVFSPEFAFATPPAVGDTAIAGQTIDWAAQFPADPLVNAARGDIAVMTQLTARTSGSETYSALERSGTAASFTQTDGAASTLTAALSAVPQRSLAVHWRGTKLDALRAEVGAGAVAFDAAQGLFIDALPDAAEFGFYTTSPDLMLYTPSAGATDIDLTVTFGDPFTTQGKPWDEYAIINYLFRVPVQLGTATPANEITGYISNLSLRQLHGTVEPLISPVRNVRIAGKDLRAPQSGVGTSPTVCWDPPRVGRATQYVLALKRLTAPSGRTVSTTIATFVTKELSLRIPDAFIAADGTYLLSITAVNFGDVDRTKDLLGDGLPFESARSVTSMFTP